MKLPIYKRISREDLKDAPDWIGNLLYPINQVFETTYNTLNRNITFGDNFLSFQKSVQFTTLSTYSSGDWDPIIFGIPDIFRVRVGGVLILKYGPVDSSLIAGSDPVSLIWSEVNRTLQIDWIAGLSNSTEYVFSVLVI